MLWMETYFCYYSVRLGVMVISVVSFISLFVPSILLFAMGLRVFNPALKIFNEDGDMRENFAVKIVTEQVENDSQRLKVLLQLNLFAHMAATILAFYGALKLKKYFLVPLIVFELWRLILVFIFHILIMTALKSRLNLGILITLTLAGGFCILYIGYNWVTCVALYQIINLVKSERYKAIYGDDPFKPLIPKSYNPMVIEDIRVLVTPTNYDIKEQRKLEAPYNYMLQSQAVISVLPVNYLERNSDNYKTESKFKKSQWPTTTLKTPPNSKIYPSTEQLYKNNYNNEVNYNNWHSSELAPAVSARNKNIYLSSKWNY